MWAVNKPGASGKVCREQRVGDALVYVRAVHFAATIAVAGVAFFLIFIAEPAFRGTDAGTQLLGIVRPRLAWIAWISLMVTVVTGAAWLVLLAQSMSDSPLEEVFSEGILWTVLLETGFGRDWLARFVLACFLAGLLVPFLSAQRVKPVWIKVVVAALAATLVGTLAWAGHAVGGPGIEAIIHPAADFLHLVAAAAWVGMLLPLALVLAAAGRDTASVSIARTATVRFSTIGIASVGTLLVMGSINTWYLAGSLQALTDTDYGRLLLTKVALFLVMVAIAAINRLHYTPRLAQVASAFATQEALRHLRRNTVIEVVLGAIIICIVAVLGVTPHGSHHFH
jgi:putative copper resistance protein D